MTKVRTSWFSSSSSIVPRYPSLLSAKRGDANNLRHSIWPKCVRSPSVKRYSSLATLFLLAIHHEPHPLCLYQPFGAPYVGISALFPEARPDGRTLFLYDGSLICNSLRSPHAPDELLHCECISPCKAKVSEELVRTRAHGGLEDPRRPRVRICCSNNE